MPIRVYNTLTRQKEDFQTVTPGHVGMYLCGPTLLPATVAIIGQRTVHMPQTL